MYPLARRPAADIAFRLVLGSLCLLLALARVLTDAASWVTPVLVVVGTYDVVTGLRRLHLHRRGELVDRATRAAVARILRQQEDMRDRESESEIVDEWHSDDDWLLVSRLGGRGPETHEITFDDWIAHLHDDAVDEYVRALRTRPRVRRAFREDREVVLVVAPGVPTEVLGREAHAWFRDRVTEPADLRD